ncbi:MAG TPA: TraR/DksA family transcriptional regulator [Elusimicrobiota bacterium]|jgi:DnaK suppressor protein|nr:TraR/DksA family transcriptional regulator [Elusimicrobiota bacterium]
MAKKTVKKAAATAAKSAPSAKKPAGASAGRGKELAWLTPAKIKDIRAELVGMRDDILKTVRKQQMEEGVDNGDSVDQASQSIEKELLFELSDNERGTLDMIEAAIRKVDNGTYGLCEATQRPIGRQRLEAIPYCRYSIEYQNQLENKESETEPGPDFSTIGEFSGGAEG